MDSVANITHCQNITKDDIMMKLLDTNNQTVADPQKGNDRFSTVKEDRRTHFDHSDVTLKS